MAPHLQPLGCSPRFPPTGARPMETFLETPPRVQTGAVGDGADSGGGTEPRQ